MFSIDRFFHVDTLLVEKLSLFFSSDPASMKNKAKNKRYGLFHVYFYLMIPLSGLFFPFNLDASTSFGIPGYQQQMNIGGRMLALGSAFDSVSDNVQGVYYNPAGLGCLDKFSITGSYLPVWDNQTYIYFTGAAIPTKYCSIGAGWIHLAADGIKIRTDSPEVSRLAAYQDNSFYLCAGKNLYKNLFVGIRIGYLTQEVVSYGDWGLGADLAFLWKNGDEIFVKQNNPLMYLVQRCSCGIVIYNLVPPSLKLKESREKNPLKIKSSLTLPFVVSKNILRLQCGYGFEAVPDYGSYVHNVGLEFILKKNFRLYSGYRFPGYVFTFGGGMSIKNMDIDIGYMPLLSARNYFVISLIMSIEEK